eukprot:CAMPEP_0182480040 /NCGR_PEP_ID=MMETSP1319-20130603/35174_1 /TAXON_ID=172717 /ORGANISM="Bolidomonas pacifica, Strain RCC208" /LENGTH=275 /DNA_ID=CAMNT_0024681505 /DNA_START=23 /DNA_END=847 /DNA_ORIENTATION=+
MSQSLHTIGALTTILGGISSLCYGLTYLQTPASPPPSARRALGFLPLRLPDPEKEPSKYHFEVYCVRYSVVWMAIFGCIVAFQIYESFLGPYDYLLCCGILSLPNLLSPLFLASHTPHPTASYASKATVYLAVYSFIGNYFYTHYFYAVLKAEYTFPGVRLNDVPIGMYFATMFYFTSYHSLSNSLLRFIDTSYAPSTARTALAAATVGGLAYGTAFMESLSISSFPYYKFEDRDMVYVVGSAFYGIYFLFSFPMFYYFDRDVDMPKGGRVVGLW